MKDQEEYPIKDPRDNQMMSMETSTMNEEDEEQEYLEPDFIPAEEKHTFPSTSELIKRLGNAKVRLILDLKCNYILLGPGLQFITPFIFIAIFVAVYFYYQKLFKCENALWVMFLVKISAICFLLNLMKVSFTNPGHVIRTPPIEDQPPGYYRCEICWVSREEARKHSIVHCDDCNVCTRGYDHHCVVLGNCVGARNLWNFNLMLFLFIGTVFMVYVGLFYAIYACGIQSVGNNAGLKKEKFRKIIHGRGSIPN